MQAVLAAEPVGRSLVHRAQRCVLRYAHAADRIPLRIACPGGGAVAMMCVFSTMHVPSPPSDTPRLEARLHPQVQLIHVVEAPEQCAVASPGDQAAERHRKIVDG